MVVHRVAQVELDAERDPARRGSGARRRARRSASPRRTARPARATASRVRATITLSTICRAISGTSACAALPRTAAAIARTTLRRWCMTRRRTAGAPSAGRLCCSAPSSRRPARSTKPVDARAQPGAAPPASRRRRAACARGPRPAGRVIAASASRSARGAGRGQAQRDGALVVATSCAREQPAPAQRLDAGADRRLAEREARAPRATPARRRRRPRRAPGSAPGSGRRRRARAAATAAPARGRLRHRSLHPTYAGWFERRTTRVPQRRVAPGSSSLTTTSASVGRADLGVVAVEGRQRPRVVRRRAPRARGRGHGQVHDPVERQAEAEQERAADDQHGVVGAARCGARAGRPVGRRVAQRGQVAHSPPVEHLAAQRVGVEPVQVATRRPRGRTRAAARRRARTPRRGTCTSGRPSARSGSTSASASSSGLRRTAAVDGDAHRCPGRRRATSASRAGERARARRGR